MPLASSFFFSLRQRFHRRMQVFPRATLPLLKHPAVSFLLMAVFFTARKAPNLPSSVSLTLSSLSPSLSLCPLWQVTTPFTSVCMCPRATGVGGATAGGRATRSGRSVWQRTPPTGRTRRTTTRPATASSSPSVSVTERPPGHVGGGVGGDEGGCLAS